MKKIALILGGLMLSASALAEDGSANAESGKRIYEGSDKCQNCHENGKGFGLKAKKMEELDSWVRNCDVRFETNWYDQDVKDVVAYLNQQYYKFPTEEVSASPEPTEGQENLDLPPPAIQQDEAGK